MLPLTVNIPICVAGLVGLMIKLSFENVTKGGSEYVTITGLFSSSLYDGKAYYNSELNRSF